MQRPTQQGTLTAACLIVLARLRTSAGTTALLKKAGRPLTRTQIVIWRVTPPSHPKVLLVSKVHKLADIIRQYSPQTTVCVLFYKFINFCSELCV
ncbi:MAG: hypothetical protein IKU47_01955, partial [Oscillospiraceae bacterium]|nr:hypothetical protein [Oscillospiraceae bacterium]